MNPLRCSGTSIPAPGLIAAKLVSLAVVVALPFWGIGWQVSAIALLVALWFNKFVRLSCIGLAVIALFHGEAVASLFLVLIAIPGALGVRMMQALMATVYALVALRTPFPSNLVWIAIVIVLVMERTRTIGIWAALSAAIAMAEIEFGYGPLFYVMTVGLIAFHEWPVERIVIFDGECGICNRIRVLWTRLDFDRAFTWTPYQSQAGERWGIPEAELKDSIHFVTDSGWSRGFVAWKNMLRQQPALYLLAGLLIIVAPAGWPKRILIGLVFCFFFPLFAPIGEAVYGWVARNRHRLPGEGACAVEPPK